MRKPLLYVFLFAFSTRWPCSLTAQSVADLARQQRARITARGMARKVYTNDDLVSAHALHASKQDSSGEHLPEGAPGAEASELPGFETAPGLLPKEKIAGNAAVAPRPVDRVNDTKNRVAVTPKPVVKTPAASPLNIAAAVAASSPENASGEVRIISAKFSNPPSDSDIENTWRGSGDTIVPAASVAPVITPVSAAGDGGGEKGAGELSVVYQSFYNRINSSTTANVNGAAVSFVHFFPGLGLLSLRFEPLSDRGGFVTGENFAQWKGLPWKGKHWDFALGDFHTSTALQPTPFTNLIQPDFFLRGAKVSTSSSAWRYSLYGGQETLAQGQRVPFRAKVPQTALGGDVSGQPLQKLKIGIRYLHLSSSEESVNAQASLFPLNRQFLSSDSLVAQTDVKLAKDLEWYTETGLNRAATLQPGGSRNIPYSLATGPSWQTPHLTLQANYVRQGVSYLPLLGSFLGDRQGPNGDAILHLGRLELSSSWSQLHNNLEQNPDTPNFSSRQSSGGLNVRLPWKFSLGGSVSKIALAARSPGQPNEFSDNRQINATLSRPLFAHNLRTTFQQLDIRFSNAVQRLRFFELEDNYHWRRFTVGGAARWQHVNSAERKDSLFARGSAQMQFGNLSLYSYIEQGKELRNSTLFATNITSTSVVGLSWFAARRMTVQLEAFRNNTNINLNPASIFVLTSQGIPIDTALSRFNNWSVYLRIARQFDWGEHPPLDASGNIQRQAPLVGSLAGFVKLHTTAGSFGAPYVSVVLDSWRSVPSDATGYFQISEVPEGTHTMALDVERLPANLNPSDPSEVSVQVRHDQLTRVELAVIPLQTVLGSVSNASGTAGAEGIVIRLLPGERYTLTDRLGRFGFYNVSEGDYVAELDTKSLPEYGQLVSAPRFPLALRHGTAAPDVNFVYQIVLPPPKPLQKILLSER